MSTTLIARHSSIKVSNSLLYYYRCLHNTGLLILAVASFSVVVAATPSASISNTTDETEPLGKKLPSKTVGTVLMYKDIHGRIAYTDGKLVMESKYQLISKRTYYEVKKDYEGIPHLPIKINTSTSGKTKTSRRKSQFNSMIARIAEEIHISANLIHAVMQAESGYNPKARSPAGAIGLMQLMPATARRYGVTDIWDPEQNITGGARYLRALLKYFKNNRILAIAAYNAGEGAVIKYGNQVPPYRETREYVRRVIANLAAMEK